MFFPFESKKRNELKMLKCYFKTIVRNVPTFFLLLHLSGLKETSGDREKEIVSVRNLPNR